MKRVLIGVDGTKSSKAVFSVFDNLVRPPEEVILVHVERLEGDSLMTDMLGDAEMKTLKEMLAGSEHKAALDRKAERILSHYRKALEDGGLVSVKTIVREGNPSEEILKVAEEENADMIVLGYNGKGMFDRLITGCVSRDVEKSARVPVVVARAAEEAADAVPVGFSAAPAKNKA